jgi:hypothetical protein
MQRNLNITGTVAPNGVLSREEDRHKPCPVPTTMPVRHKQQMIEAITKAISDAMYWNGTVMCTPTTTLAETALAVIEPHVAVWRER